MPGAHILSLSTLIWNPEHCKNKGNTNKHYSVEARIFINTIGGKE